MINDWDNPLLPIYPKYREVKLPPSTINQTKKDLIGLLMEAPSISPINYISDGIYDRVLTNFTEHAKELNIPDHDQYDWNRVPVNDLFLKKTIYLQKPNKEIRQKIKFFQTKDGRLKNKYNWINVVKLSLYFYRSGTDPKIVAYTFGDRYGDRLIKPFKILKHDWEKIKLRLPLNKFNIIANLSSSYIDWECKICGLRGYSNSESELAIIPSNALTCDEVKIRNIII